MNGVKLPARPATSQAPLARSVFAGRGMHAPLTLPYDPRNPPMVRLYGLISRLGRIPISDVVGRELIITPSLACYGRTAHLLLSIGGSPPRGTILYDAEWGGEWAPAWLIVQDRISKIRGEGMGIVREFVELVERSQECGGGR